MIADSLIAIALFAACVGAWWQAASLRAPARLPLRFAAVLLSALAVAAVLNMGTVAALLLLPLSSAALAQSVLARLARAPGQLLATLLLVVALACGLWALVTGYAMPALMLMMLAGLCIIAAGLHALAWPAILSGAALLVCGLCFLQAGAGAGVLLFAAAAVMGLARPKKARPQLLRSTSSAMRTAALP